MAKSQRDLSDFSEKGEADNINTPLFPKSVASVLLSIVSLFASIGLAIWTLKFYLRDAVLSFTDYNPITPRSEVISEFALPLILLVLLSGIPVVLAIIMGHSTLRNARRNHQRQRGSIARLVLGYCALPISAFTISIAVYQMVAFLMHS